MATPAADPDAPVVAALMVTQARPGQRSVDLPRRSAGADGRCWHRPVAQGADPRGDRGRGGRDGPDALVRL